MPSDIYPIVVDNDEMQELFNILNKYQNTILEMAKVVGSGAAQDYNRAVQIINKVLDKAEASINPPACLSKACKNSNYCYMPQQCAFVLAMKAGHSVARVSSEQLPAYMALGWELAIEDTVSAPSARKHLVIYKKSL